MMNIVWTPSRSRAPSPKLEFPQVKIAGLKAPDPLHNVLGLRVPKLTDPELTFKS